MVQAVLAVSLFALPKEFSGIFTEDKERVVKNWHLFFCVCTGLWGGLIIGLVTEYYTSNAFQPVQVLLFSPYLSILGIVNIRQKVCLASNASQHVQVQCSLHICAQHIC